MTRLHSSKIHVLLTKPPVGRYPLGYDLYPPMIPMGLGFLARVLRDNSISYSVYDQYLASYKTRVWDKASYLQCLLETRPTHVCLSSMSVEWPEALGVIRTTREFLPECKVIVGGPHAHFAADEISSLVDWVVVGEGERALLDILRGTIHHDCVRGNVVEYPFIEDLDSLVSGPDGEKDMIPWVDFSPLSYDLCMPEWGLDRKPVVNLNTSRGCPFSCKFCSILGPWGRGFRCFSSRVVVDEVARLQESFGVCGVCFREDNFTVARKRVEEICRALLDRGIKIQWAAEARVDSLDKALIELMSSSGCKGLLFGVESGSDRMLKAMKKQITTLDTRRTVALCKDYGIKTYCSVVYGLPGELPGDREATKDFIREIQPDFLEESVYLGIPGSAYYEDLRSSGMYEFFDPTTLHIYPFGYKELFDELFCDTSILPY
jgi:anaerobic magnesium-protoporphyrin IX monomethyl ester cyclase